MVRGESTAGKRAGSVAPRLISAPGRAGRTGPGTCIRLWSERDHSGRAEFEQPEIHRVDLSGAVLALHAWGVRNPVQFDWFDAPKAERLIEAERLSACWEPSTATPLGSRRKGKPCWHLPVHPRLARLFVAARRVQSRSRRRGDRRASLGERHPAPNGSGQSRRAGRTRTLDRRKVRHPRPNGLAGRGGGSPLCTRRFRSGHRPGCRAPGGPAARRPADEVFVTAVREFKRSNADDELLKWVLLAYPGSSGQAPWLAREQA